MHSFTEAANIQVFQDSRYLRFCWFYIRISNFFNSRGYGKKLLYKIDPTVPNAINVRATIRVTPANRS